MGHKHKLTPGGLHFINPYGGGKATRFDANVRFPLPKGDSWQQKLDDHKSNSDAGNTTHINAYVAETNMLMHINEIIIKERMANDEAAQRDAIAALAEQLNQQMTLVCIQNTLIQTQVD